MLNYIQNGDIVTVPMAAGETVSSGDLVRQGDLIARVGKTGRATGPHLHWGVSAGPTPLDPLRLINRQFR